MSRLSFQLEAECTGSNARASTFTTLHGTVNTPIFMPVGTQATVRTLNVDTLHHVGANVLLANTYHLLIRPGIEVFQKLGGIHKFMNWNKPVLTDSGGFQIFSLPNARQMSEEGAIFRSYVDGQNILLSPEISINMQKAIGSDIMMVLDECVPSTVDHSRAKEAMLITHRWAKRSLKARGESPQSMFGIVQGACFPDLRKESAKVLTELPFDGYAIGGLAVGETKEERNDFCELSASLLPKNLPRYLMGVGTPLDLLEAVHRGVDMFDCTIPVELAQRGVAFTSFGKLQIHRGIYKFSSENLDSNCKCRCCTHYSRAYLHHLIKSNEILGWQLIAEHNLTYYHTMMQSIRDSILAGTFLNFYNKKKEEVLRSDNVNPPFTIKSPKRDKRRFLGDYEVIESLDHKFYSIRQISSGEVMHSVNDPMLEAKTLYVNQSNLSERLDKNLDDNDSLVVWDVGLGAATNSMAIINSFEDISPITRKSLVIESFEIDLQPLKLCLRNHGKFPHLFHKAPIECVTKGYWENEDGTLSWFIREGDFLETYTTANAPDIIFYDPFSYKTNHKLWNPDWFVSFHNYLIQFQKPISLYTYSASTSIRASLLNAGFFVGKGIGSGPKLETTIAYVGKPSKPAEVQSLLGKEWLSRWQRSDAKYPIEVEINKNEWEAHIMSHPQFHLKDEPITGSFDSYPLV